MNARDLLLEVLRTEGVRRIFGNPGSTELPLVDALAGADDLHYVLALQESTAIGVAEGYARATGRPAFVNLHTSAGLGNAIGALTSAQANHVPLVVTAGQQDTRHLVTDPLLAGDLTGLADAVSKWVHEVRTPAELGVVLRRAFHDAVSPPAGPVFVSIPMDLLDDPDHQEVPAPSVIHRRPVAGTLDALADLLTTAPIGKVAIVAGDEVSASGAEPELVELAEALGSPVHGAPLHGSAVFPAAHPLWAGMLVAAASAMHAVLARYDRVLFVGGRAFTTYPYTDGPTVPANVELLHLSADPHQLGRTHATRWAAAGDPKASLAALLPLVSARIDAPSARRAADAVAAARTRRAVAMDRLEQTALARYSNSPTDAMAAVHALIGAMPPDSFVVDESISTSPYVRGLRRAAEPGRYFFNRGAGLGWGMPMAVGVSMGHERAPVLAVIGDGSAMYSPQALWTAAHENTPVVFAIVNNRQYGTLNSNLRSLGGDSVRTGRFVGTDLTRPDIDFVALANSMGVDATRVDKAHDISEAVLTGLESGRPVLLDIPIAAS